MLSTLKWKSNLIRAGEAHTHAALKVRKDTGWALVEWFSPEDVYLYFREMYLAIERPDLRIIRTLEEMDQFRADLRVDARSVPATPEDRKFLLRVLDNDTVDVVLYAIDRLLLSWDHTGYIDLSSQLPVFLDAARKVALSLLPPTV